MTYGEGAFPPEDNEKLRVAVGEIATLLRDLGLTVSARRAEVMVEQMQNPGSTWQRFKIAAGEVYNVFRCESEDRLFLYVSPDRARFYEAPQLFGESVHKAFPSASYDVEQAGNCYALGFNTGCVFHLMRVLERGLVALAKRFSIPAEHSNWHNIIEQIKSKVRTIGSEASRLPDWKEQQEFYSQAASHFMTLKDAWRNYTAHARGKYDETEARRILENVQGFMEKLASRLSEES
ncbi:MAG: hypothetical protein L0338_35780 [Acidobacteria bacterium]|nr:hypothetical protein [Acidobacteriota bacterium]